MSNLYTPAAATLRHLRAKADEWNAKPYARNAGQYTWRDMFSMYRPNITKGRKYRSGQSSYSAEKQCYFLDSLDNWPTPARPASECTRYIDHTGWYADNNFQDNLVRPHVVTLRHKKHGPVYLPAIDYSAWDGATVYTGTYYDNETSAAYAADRIAELEAEQCREDDAKDQAEQEIIRLKEEIHELNRETLPLIAEIKAQKHAYTPHVCQALRDTLAEAMRERSRKFERISKLNDDYWLAVQ